MLAGVAALSLAATAIAAPQAPASPETAAIVRAFEEYRRALIERDGTRALSIVTPASVADYERMRKLALSLSRAELLQADTLDRYMVLMLRSRFSGAELRSMSGADLVRQGVDKGWIGSNLPSGARVSRVAGDTAYLSFTKDGRDIPGEVPFVKRIGTAWLIDIIELSRLTRPALLAMFTKLADAAGTDVNGAMLMVIAKLTGQQPPDSVWDRPS